MKKLFGVTTAMVTPFATDGSVMRQAIPALVDFLVAKGVNCLYPVGTTGEMYRLSVEERIQIAECVVKQANGRVTVFIHVGAMRLDDTLALARHAHDIGADGIGAVTPAYFSVTDHEMEEYYVSIAQEVPEDFPLYLYNIPQCSRNDLTPEVARRITARCTNVVGIKYSYPDLLRTMEYLGINGGSFSVIHGTDRLFFTLLTMGCAGTVSGIACVFPEVFVALYTAYQAGRWQEAARLQKTADRLGIVLRGGSNLSYFKTALRLRGIDAGVMRRPQLDIGGDEIDALTAELRSIEEINRLL